MGFIFKTIGWLLLLLVVGAGVAVFLMVEDAPLVPDSEPMTGADLERARVFLQNSDPRNLADGEMSALTIDEQELELLLDYLLQNLRGGGSQVDIGDGSASLAISARVPDKGLGDYLNLQMDFLQLGDALVLEELQIGGLVVPGPLADYLMKFAHAQLKQRVPEYQAAWSSIHGFTIGDEQIGVVYLWREELLEQLSTRGRELLISEEDRERLLAHVRNLSAVTNDPALPVTVPLIQVMRPMFQFASLRGGDPVEENRAALSAMSMYVMGINAANVLGESADGIPAMGRHRLTLGRRQDFAQHFLVSAGLTVSTGTGLADSIGLLKELDDSQSGGSGFSFTDIGADRTGVRFAELAVAGPEQARAVQQRMIAGAGETDFMADFADLPEFMPEEEFISRYDGIGAPAYNAVVADIEARINAMPFFRELK